MRWVFRLGPLARGLAIAVVTAAAVLISAQPSPPALMPVKPTSAFTFAVLPLETGSRVAVARLGPPPTPERPPLVFVHGGPGAPPQQGSLALLEALAARGVPVVLFHQAGVGRSPRLSANTYSLERSVADLEGLRKVLNVDTLSLLGGSFGARLAYEYVARHPAHVARAIFTSAGPLEPGAWAFDVKAELKELPRPSGWWLSAMALANSGALPLVPRAELDAAMSIQAAKVVPMLYCPGHGPAAAPTPVGGYDGAQFLALRADLARQPVPAAPAPAPPALVIRPQCDVMPWSAARDYRDRLGATLVMVPGMGHVVSPAELPLVAELVADFLQGQPLPLPAWNEDSDPATQSKAAAPPR